MSLNETYVCFRLFQDPFVTSGPTDASILYNK